MVSFLHIGGLFRPVHWRNDIQLAILFGISLTLPPSPTPIMVWWCTPSFGSVKVNTDGCVKNGFASGRGIIRDYAGN